MNTKERIKLIKAMETIARTVNNEEVFEYWLSAGIEDGLIDGTETDSDFEWYCRDNNFADLMEVFLHLMCMAKKSGGLYFDKIVSKYDK